MWFMAKAKVSNELEIVYLKKIYLSRMTSVLSHFSSPYKGLLYLNGFELTRGE